MIFDYLIPMKKDKINEVQNFIEFAKTYLIKYPTLERPFRAVISNNKNLLFGHNKSNETKMKETLAIIDSCYKLAKGLIDRLEYILSLDYESEAFKDLLN